MGALNSKVAVVTGGAQGIGKGIARALGKEGAHIVLVDVKESALIDCARELEALGVCADCVIGDVGDAQTAEEACRVAEQRHGHLDALVNCAQAMVSGVSFERHSDEDFDRAISTGLWGAFRFMREAFPLLAVSGGAIVNIVSSAGTHGGKGLAGYAAAKEGIRGLTKVAANEWGHSNIRVNAICPQANTPTSEEYFRLYPDRRAERIAQRPIQRDGDAELDVGRAVVFLVGPDSGFITGVTLMVNGGLTIMP
jgi:NAD(P)-dependent dehydrogenase (short-subunit alcohol dehydrogenase family)